MGRDIRKKLFTVAGITAALMCTGCTDQKEGSLINDVVFREEMQLPTMDHDLILPEITSEKETKSLLGKHGYFYSILSREEQQIYEEIYAAMIGDGEQYPLSTLDQELVASIHNLVCADHPEIFWTSGYTVHINKKGEQVVSLKLTMKRIMENTEITVWQQTIGNYLQVFNESQNQAGITETSSDYDKIRFTFDYIVKNTEYLAGVSNNQNICSVFGDGYSVCMGYARAMQYLLQYQGIESITVPGSTNGGVDNHAWNLVKADGEWYQLDVTWGDPSYDENSTTANDVINYAYFCVTDELISRTHTVNAAYETPACTATANNYFLKENLYFSVWDETQFQNALAKALDQNEEFLSIRFADEASYLQMKEILLNESDIFRYFSEYAENRGVEKIKQITYLEDSKFYILTFIW